MITYVKFDCEHKDTFKNLKSYSNHRRWCLGKIKSKAWKGDNVSYKTLHQWVRRWLKKPSFCQKCNISQAKEVANVSGSYKRDLKDWLWLCVLCHRIMDGQVDRFVKQRPFFKMKGYLKGKNMSESIKFKIAATMKEKVKIRLRNPGGMFI